MYSMEPGRRTGRALLLAILVGAALASTAARPAGGQELTVERIFTSGEFFARSLPETSWTPDGDSLTFLSRSGRNAPPDLVAEDVETGARSVLVEGAGLVPPGRDEPITIEGYSFSADGAKLLLFTETRYVWRDRTEGLYYVYDRRTDDLRALSHEFGWQRFAKFSPDGSRVGFVRDSDLWVVDLETGEETRLTFDGSDTVFNGIFDWVYEEELGLQDGWRWSPDGTRIAYWRIDDAPVRSFVYDLEYGELYPDPVTVPYPKVGQPNPLARIGVIRADGGDTRWIDTGEAPDTYLARMEWAGGSELVIQRLNRRQNRLEVLLADSETGQSRVVHTDESDTWVDVDDHFRWIGDHDRFLWSSERDGYRHLYLHERSGELVRQLTEGPWVISTPVGVDEEGGWVYFTAHRASPLQTNLYRVPLAGGEVERVTPEDGTHDVRMNPTATHFLDTRSRRGVPPTSTLRRGGGETVRTLVENGDLAGRLEDLGVRRPEFFRFTTSDDVELNGWMIRPPDFDSSRRYPVLMYVYGGPGSQTVTDEWTSITYAWHQLMAERGYIVVSVDGRGTGGRGRAFKNQVYLRLGELETRDQVEAARYLASLDYVDGDRIGIYGSSYGGYMTLLALSRGDGIFRAGVSRAPVTDWRLYDTIYTERYMWLPRENRDGYEQGAPLTHAADLQGRLLLLHGTGDDNVHFQNSARMVERLQEAGKQFDFMIYPNKTHAIRGLEANLHLYTMMTEFLLENL